MTETGLFRRNYMATGCGVFQLAARASASSYEPRPKKGFG
jgi:hypothetical protein